MSSADAIYKLFTDGVLFTLYSSLFFFQNEVIFVQLDELDELDRIIHAWIRINLQSHTSTENVLVLVRVTDC